MEGALSSVKKENDDGYLVKFNEFIEKNVEEKLDRLSKEPIKEK